MHTGQNKSKRFEDRFMIFGKANDKEKQNCKENIKLREI